MFLRNYKEFGSKEAYLFYLYNNVGYKDLEICHNYEKGGDLLFSKWIKFDYLMHIEPNDKVEGTWFTRTEFINKATHRSVLDIEIVYDFDEDDKGSKKPEDIKRYAKKSIAKLNKAGVFGICYFSGSKSIHYHVLVSDLRIMSKHDRTMFKERALAPYNVRKKGEEKSRSFTSDLQKKSPRSMIALEGANHWKTGKKKEVIDL